MDSEGAARQADKVLLASDDDAVIEQLTAAFDTKPRKASQRITIDPDKVGRDLARLVLGVVELLRDLMERQAVRRVESGSLTDEETERLGQTLLALERRMLELKAAFGLENDDLTLNLGGLQNLLSDDD
ncbi:MAG: gas vesicle protein K [Devosia sp.]|nr:gas vesicle protein K [Devosia sp.]